MDKIREEFEKGIVSPSYIKWENDKYISEYPSLYHMRMADQMNISFTAYGLKFRDEEIEKLKDALEKSLEFIYLAPELNINNYNKNDVIAITQCITDIYNIMKEALKDGE